MTELEWSNSGNPERMLAVIRDHASPRQMRLYACACCRIFWLQMKRTACQTAIDVAESFADGLASSNDLHSVRAAVRNLRQHGRRPLVNAAEAVTREAAWAGALRAQRELIQFVWSHKGSMHPYSSAKEDAYRQQADLVRDIFGNPFHSAVLDPDWLTWRDGTAVKLAQTIYDDRRWDMLPILADALHEAGCCDDTILAHCRGPGPHVRGCWVVDLVLGKS